MTPGRTSFPRRMWRATRLHAPTYEEVEADPASIWQATTVVMGAALAGALGSFWLHASHRGIPWTVAMLPVVLEILEPIVLWSGASFFVYMVGATFFRGPETETDYREVLRTLGFAFTPAILRGLGYVLPGLQTAVGLPASESPRILFNFAMEAWVLVAGTVAIRQALDYDTLRAIGTFGVSFLLLVLVINGLGATLQSPPEVVLLLADFLRAVL